MFLALYQYNIVIAIDTIHHFHISSFQPKPPAPQGRDHLKYRLELYLRPTDGQPLKPCNFLTNNEFDNEDDAITALNTIVQHLPAETLIEVPKKRGITYNCGD